MMRPDGSDLELILGLVSAGKLKPYVDSVFHLERLSDAHRRAEKYGTEGKILINIR